MNRIRIWSSRRENDAGDQNGFRRVHLLQSIRAAEVHYHAASAHKKYIRLEIGRCTQTAAVRSRVLLEFEAFRKSTRGDIMKEKNSENRDEESLYESVSTDSLSVEVLQCTPSEKGRFRVVFSNGICCQLYRSEIRQMQITLWLILILLLLRR